MAHMAEAHSAPTLSAWHWLSWDVQLLVAQCIALCPIALLQGSVLWHAVQGGFSFAGSARGKLSTPAHPTQHTFPSEITSSHQDLDPCCRKVAQPAQSGGAAFSSCSVH